LGMRGDPPGSAKCEVPDPRPDLGREGGHCCGVGDARPGGHGASLFSPSECEQDLNLEFRSPVPWATLLPLAVSLTTMRR
jgi:hypothetical protein